MNAPAKQPELINFITWGFPDVVDFSILSSFASCRRKGFWSHIRCLTTETSVHLHAGAAYASALKELRHAYYTDKVDLDTAIRRGFVALTKAYGSYDPPLDAAKSWLNMVHSFLAYVRYYPLDTDLYVPHEIGGKKCIEFSFAIPLPILHPITKQPLIFAGRADMIATDGTSLMLVDDKTTGQMGATWPEQWQMRGQFPGYLWAAQQYGFHCHGVLVRGVSIQKTQTKHLQVPVHFAQWQIDRWYEDLIQRTQHYIWCHENNFWPVDGEFNNKCADYGGCAFRLLCTSPDPESWTSKFIVHRWNPLAGDMPDASN